MKGYPSLNRAGVLSILILLLLAIAPVPQPVSASSPVAISGSFYAQKFEIPAGGVVKSSSVYVVAFNQGAEPVTFQVGYTAPPGVTLDLSESEFVLSASQSKEVLVAVCVAADAVPGSYEIAVNVKGLGGGSGIEMLGAAEQVAPLTVVDEAGDVHVETVRPGGERIPSHVRLWKIIEGNQYEYAESVTGVIDGAFSPGKYTVKAFSMGVELASEEFNLVHLKQKSLTMTVDPVYFKSFDVVQENASAGERGQARVLYTIANIYKPLEAASVDLVVMHDGDHLETVSAILPTGVLDTGDTIQSYSYVPSAGWERGSYSYRLELYIGGDLYASTRNVTPGEGKSGSWPWAVWVVVGVVCVAGLGSLIYLARRWRKE